MAAASAPEIARLSPAFAATSDPARGQSYSPRREVLLDLAQARIADMDAGGVDVQVLSCLTTQQLPADVAPDLVRAANDRAAAAVAAHPDRFAPVLAGLAELGKPLYLHPGFPPREVSELSYEGGLDPLVAGRMQTSAWGWHQETAVHFLHLVLSGVFDRHPDLQVILGHWGEMIPFYLDRLDEALPRALTGLERTIGDYVRQNAYLTPSGMFSQAQLRFCVDTVGVDRVLWSVDYPFIGTERASAFLDEADLSADAKEAVAHRTTERLLGL